jgi:hypothetical protein
MTRKPFIAIAFDGVIHDSTDLWELDHVIPNGPVPGAIQFLRDLIEDRRFIVCIVTSRRHGKLGIQPIIDWLAPHLTKLQLEQIYIDARSLTFVGSFPAMDRLMAFLPYDRKPRHLRPDPETGMAVVDSLMMQIGQIAKDAGWQPVDEETPIQFIREAMAKAVEVPHSLSWEYFHERRARALRAKLDRQHEHFAGVVADVINLKAELSRIAEIARDAMTWQLDRDDDEAAQAALSGIIEIADQALAAKP